MKIAFVGLVLIAAAASANATSINDLRDLHHGSSNAPVCPQGQIAEYLGIINGKPTWRCVWP